MLSHNIKRIIIGVFVICLARGSAAQSRQQTVEQVRYNRAVEMRGYINESVDPCENFYQYACGNWQPNKDPALQGLSVAAEAHNRVNRKLIQLMMEDSDVWSSSVEQKVKMFYASCVNMVTSMDGRLRWALEQIASEFGVMPAMDVHDEFDELAFDWQQTVAEIAYKYDIKIILDYKAAGHFDNSSLNVMLLDAGDFPLGPLEFYLSEKFEAERGESKIQIAEDLQRYFGLTEEMAELTASEIVDFEVSLVRGTLGDPIESLEQVRTTVNTLHWKYAPALDLKKFLHTSYDSIPSDVIYVMSPNYQQNLLEVMDMAPKRVVANYVFYRLLKTFIPVIPRKRAALQLSCLEYTRRYFPKNLDNMFYRKYSPNKMIEGIEGLWPAIKQTLQNFLQSYRIEWMGNASRKSALAKLESMTMRILSYENYDFHKDFQHLRFSEDNYIGNLKALFKLQALKARAKFSGPPVHDGKDSGLSTPQYSLTENSIRIPMSTLNPYDLYAPFYPSAINFAQLGALIGREVMRGFIGKGATKDKYGNTVEWWDRATTDDFASYLQCFQDQAKALALENMATNGGLRLAYEAYFQYHAEAMQTAGKADLEPLRAFYYNSNRMFFISYAQMYCRSSSEQIESSKAAERVSGTVSNFEEFAKEFQCRQGSPMNRPHKCRVL